MIIMPSGPIRPPVSNPGLERPSPEIERRLRNVEDGVQRVSTPVINDGTGWVSTREFLYIAYASALNPLLLNGRITSQNHASDFGYTPFDADGILWPYRGRLVSTSIYASGDPTDYVWELTDLDATNTTYERQYSENDALLTVIGNPDITVSGISWTAAGVPFSATSSVPSTAYWVADRFTVDGVQSAWQVYPVRTGVSNNLGIMSHRIESDAPADPTGVCTINETANNAYTTQQTCEQLHGCSIGFLLVSPFTAITDSETCEATVTPGFCTVGGVVDSAGTYANQADCIALTDGDSNVIGVWTDDVPGVWTDAVWTANNTCTSYPTHNNDQSACIEAGGIWNPAGRLTSDGWKSHVLYAAAASTGLTYSLHTELGFGAVVVIQYNDIKLFGILRDVDGLATWIVPSNVIDGDLVVDGTITTEQIAANTIKAVNIEAGAITSHEVTISPGDLGAGVNTGICAISAYNNDETACNGAGGTWAVSAATNTGLCTLPAYNNDETTCGTAGGTWTATSGNRMVITADSIKVYDDDDNLRVTLGNLGV